MKPETTPTPRIRQRPWFIPLLSGLVVNPTLKVCGIQPGSSPALDFDRAAHEASVKQLPASDGRFVSREDLLVPSADGATQNRARLFRPRAAPGAADSAPTPLVVYAHGGGWCLNTGASQPWDWMCASLARDLGWSVLSLDYRRAPEHPWPCAAEDVYAALAWLGSDASAARVRADRSRVVLMGESAGGNLAAVAALMWRDRRPAGVTVAHQVLLSPCVPARPLRASRVDPARADGAFLPAWAMAWFEEAYAGPLGVDALAREPYANPLAAPSLAGLPALTGVVGGAEVLRDEGVEYFEAVRAAGVDAAWREWEGGYHAFVIFPFGDAPSAWEYVRDRLRSTV